MCTHYLYRMRAAKCFLPIFTKRLVSQPAVPRRPCRDSLKDGWHFFANFYINFLPAFKAELT